MRVERLVNSGEIGISRLLGMLQLTFVLGCVHPEYTMCV